MTAEERKTTFLAYLKDGNVKNYTPESFIQNMDECFSACKNAPELRDLGSLWDVIDYKYFDRLRNKLINYPLFKCKHRELFNTFRVVARVYYTFLKQIPKSKLTMLDSARNADTRLVPDKNNLEQLIQTELKKSYPAPLSISELYNKITHWVTWDNIDNLQESISSALMHDSVSADLNLDGENPNSKLFKVIDYTNRDGESLFGLVEYDYSKNESVDFNDTLTESTHELPAYALDYNFSSKVADNFDGGLKALDDSSTKFDTSSSIPETLVVNDISIISQDRNAKSDATLDKSNMYSENPTISSETTLIVSEKVSETHSETLSVLIP
ncbi:MAG: hypothetical protein LBE09_03905, partial [Christensenellaceae bacterium]|nr:hypothetical protein [Christensenellaceae bacterium]